MSIEKYNNLIEAARRMSLTPVVDDDFPEVKYDLDTAIFALNRGYLSMRVFSRANHTRCTAPNGFNHSIDSWSTSDWITAVVGELGEAANIVKKPNRVRDGIPGNTETEEQLKSALADEIADTFIYLDLLATSCGFDLDDIVKGKFDRTSIKIGYDRAL